MESTLKAVASRSLGKQAVINEYAEGESDASPTPTPIRHSSICAKFLASPHMAVKKLQATRPAAMMERRLRVSANRPRGIPQKV
jgi:hypothetical protein